MTYPSVVEIIGPAGIGKSTFSRSLFRRAIHSRQESILSVAQVLSVPRLRKPKVLRQLLQRYLMSSASCEPSRFLFQRRSSNSILRDASSEEWRRFISVCLDIASKDSRGSEERLLGLGFIYKTISSRLYIDSCFDGEQFVLIDEPLGYRPSMFNPLEVVPSSAMERYYEAVPLPAAIISLSANAEVIVERIANRKASGRVAHRHNGLSDTEIKGDTEWASLLANYGVHAMRERGVPVLDICAEDDMSVNVGRSLDFIDELKCTRSR